MPASDCTSLVPLAAESRERVVTAIYASCRPKFALRQFTRIWSVPNGIERLGPEQLRPGYAILFAYCQSSQPVYDIILCAGRGLRSR